MKRPPRTLGALERDRSRTVIDLAQARVTKLLRGGADEVLEQEIRRLAKDLQALNRAIFRAFFHEEIKKGN